MTFPVIDKFLIKNILCDEKREQSRMILTSMKKIGEQTTT
jgi:hypothetical protein